MRVYAGGVDVFQPARLPVLRCPRCHASQAVLAHEWYAEQSYLCPTCEHVWDIPARTTEVACPDRRMTARTKGAEQLRLGF